MWKYFSQILLTVSFDSLDPVPPPDLAGRPPRVHPRAEQGAARGGHRGAQGTAGLRRAQHQPHINGAVRVPGKGKK